MKKSDVKEAIKAVLAEGWIGAPTAMASLSRQLKLAEPDEEPLELRLDGCVEKISYAFRERDGGADGKVFVVVPQPGGGCPARLVFPVGSRESIDRWLSRYHSLEPVTVKVTFEEEKEDKMADEKWNAFGEGKPPELGELVWLGNCLGAMLEPVRWVAGMECPRPWTHWLPVALPKNYPPKPLPELDEWWHWFGIGGPHGPSISFDANRHSRMAQIVDGNVVCTGTIPKSVVAALLEAHS